jgi:membrane protein DedA with SNARE-associated domain
MNKVVKRIFILSVILAIVAWEYIFLAAISFAMNDNTPFTAMQRLWFAAAVIVPLLLLVFVWLWWQRKSPSKTV